MDWRLFALIWGGTLAGAAALLPYSLALGILAPEKLPLPLPAVLALGLLQSGILSALATLAGLWLGPLVGLGAPVLAGMLNGRTPKGFGRTALVAAAWGAPLGPLIVLLDRLAFAPVTAAMPVQDSTAPLWTRLLASLYGGINEEVLLRLGLMTLLTWALWRLQGRPAAGAAPASVWAANLAAALLFGLGHLPATAALLPLTPLVVARALLLNGIAGVVFGWLYWRRGLEAAVLAHFSAGIALHVLMPLLV